MPINPKQAIIKYRQVHYAGSRDYIYVFYKNFFYKNNAYKCL